MPIYVPKSANFSRKSGTKVVPGEAGAPWTDDRSYPSKICVLCHETVAARGLEEMAEVIHLVPRGCRTMVSGDPREVQLRVEPCRQDGKVRWACEHSRQRAAPDSKAYSLREIPQEGMRG